MNLNKQPLVSIITINYNCKNYLQNHFDSILKLSYNNWEHIFVDCGSTDGSIEIVKKNLHNRLFFHQIDFCTVSEARNFAIENCKGSICAILDSDDLICKNRITNQIKLLQNDTKNVLVGGSFVGIMNRSNLYARIFLKKRVYIKMPEDEVVINLLLDSAFLPFPHSTFTFYKDVFLKAGKYKIDKTEDYELLMNFSKLGSVVSVPEQISIINFGRMNSHSTRYKPNNRTPLHFAFYILIKDAIKNTGSTLSDEQIHKELDKFSNVQLLIMQTKWLFQGLLKENKLFDFNNLMFISNLIIKNVNTFYKISFFFKCPNTKNELINTF